MLINPLSEHRATYQPVMANVIVGGFPVTAAQSNAEEPGCGLAVTTIGQTLNAGSAEARQSGETDTEFQFSEDRNREQFHSRNGSRGSCR